MRWPLVVAVTVACVAGTFSYAMARTSPTGLRIAYVPIDDRPATSVFPGEIAAICGASVESPPRSALGHFERPGDVDAIDRWLLSLDDREVSAVVVSADMLAYGGLVASRTAATPLSQAIARLGVLERFHQAHPQVPVYVFGTVMRLAPTATTSSESYQDALTTYAQSGAGPATTPAAAAATAARASLPSRVFWDYVGS